MRRLILKMSLSIDGFVGGPEGEIGWLFRTMDEETTQWVLDTVSLAGVHIMGSRTYYDMASYWPYSTGPLAVPMNDIPKVVFSKRGSLQPISKALTTTAFKDASLLNPTEEKTFLSAGASSWADAKLANGELEEEIMIL